VTNQQICTRLTCLDTGPIVGPIRAIATGERIESYLHAVEAHREIVALGIELDDVMGRALKGRLSRIEAMAMLGDEPVARTGGAPCAG
jgi:hypothetical protein